jgi:hypothetical protein
VGRTTEAARVAVRLVGQVDELWAVVDEIEVLYTGSPQRPSHEKDPSAHFLSFVERDVIKLFLDLVRQIADMLAASGRIHFDGAAFEGDGDRLVCNLEVMRLAASDPVIAGPVRSVLQRAARRLSESFPDIAALVGALAATSRADEYHSRHT